MSKYRVTTIDPEDKLEFDVRQNTTKFFVLRVLNIDE